MRIKIIAALIALTLGTISPHSASRGDHPVERVRQTKISIDERLNDRPEIAQYYSNRCFTPYFWCYLPGPAPVNLLAGALVPTGPLPAL